MPRGHLEDLTGRVFGNLTASFHCGSVRQSTKTRFQPALWLCYCKCGYPVAKTSDQLKKGRAFKCYQCKRRKKKYSDDSCLLEKTLDGVKTYLDPKSKMFGNHKFEIPCSAAIEIKSKLERSRLPGSLKILEI